MRAAIAIGVLMLLAGCGGGGTTGTNYSDAPPLAEIVATPAAKPSATPVAEETTAEAEVVVNTVDAAEVLSASEASATAEAATENPN